MAVDLRDVVKVRELRAKLAREESRRRQQVLSGSEHAVAIARERKRSFEQRATQASTSYLQEQNGSSTQFSAAEAQRLTDFSTAALLQAREQVAHIRRAELLRERARESAQEALQDYHRQKARRDSAADQAEKVERATHLRNLERQDASVCEVRADNSSALRANGEL